MTKNDGTEDQVSYIPEPWLAEIVRETEHYYKGELEQEQRASWLLASAGVLIAVVGTLVSVKLNEFDFTSRAAILCALAAFLISAALSIRSLLPLHGTKRWGDTFGRRYRRQRLLSIDALIKERFQPDPRWSQRSYEQRLAYHYRSHYLRFYRKAYGILWSSRFLLLGMILLGVSVANVLFSFDLHGLPNIW